MTRPLGLPRRLVLGRPRAVELDRLGPHAAHADHPGGARGRALDVAADPGRVLAVEDVLGRHRPERPDQLADLLVAPAREALLLLDRLVVAQRAAALADRQAGGEHVGHVDVRGDGVAGLVDRHRAGLVGDVVDALRGARLDRRHRLDDVVPVEARGHRSARASAPSSRPARSSPGSSRW